MKMVQSGKTHQVDKSSDQGQSTQSVAIDDPFRYLLSDSEEEDSTVGVIRVIDEGSKCQCVKVVVGGAPLLGIVDSGADITIMGSNAFKQVASVAGLKKRDFKKPDKVPRNYDQQPFHVDGKIVIDIEFQERTMTTPVYVKMDAPEELCSCQKVCADSLESLITTQRLNPSGQSRQVQPLRHRMMIDVLFQW